MKIIDSLSRLAQAAETSMGYPTASAVVERARVYFNFLIGASDSDSADAKVSGFGETVPGLGQQGRSQARANDGTWRG
jgi:hypothetical protein